MPIRDMRARFRDAGAEADRNDARMFSGYRARGTDIASSGRIGAGYAAGRSETGGIASANSGGIVTVIPQTYNSTLGRYEFSGQQDLDATLIGSRWTPTTLRFSFPTSAAQYTQQYSGGGEPNYYRPFNAQQQQATRYALGLVAQYTNLGFTEITETSQVHANLRLSQTGYSQLPIAGYASSYFPSSQARAGDVWIYDENSNPQPTNNTPAIGNWGQALLMHQIGHALGLKHGSDDYTTVDLKYKIDPNPDGSTRYGSVPLNYVHNGQDWSVMTEYADPTDTYANGFEGEAFNQPQTYMQEDIAALQYLYGANFGTHSGDTTYTWNATTGQMAIDGVGQGTPTSNKISMTLWDGNGVDTYDLSNYATDLDVDLRPGEFSTFSEAQLVNHQAASGGKAIAVGNVANALLYEGDTRSLIENAIGGAGADRIVGNTAKNVLTGAGGADRLIGDAGDDTLYGGGDVDTLYGDARPGKPSGVGQGSGAFTKAAGLGNSDFRHAASITRLFASTQNADIADSTTIPHVTVSGTGDGTKDYYQISVAAGSIVTLDIDATSAGFDSYIRVLNVKGLKIASGDDSFTTDGAGGSTKASDSFLTFVAPSTSVYYFEVSTYASGSATGDPIASGATYQLQVSVADVPDIGGGSGKDILDGGAGADLMYGGGGNDLYYVDDAGDQVFEKAGEGTDKVGTSVSYTLAAGQAIEQLSTTSASGKTAINLTGNEFANTISGNAGKNTLDGKGGADTLTGRGGDDLYFVDNANDKVVEAAGEGTDKVGASVSYTLGSGQFVEQLSTTSASGTGAINLTGNEIDNTISGNAGANILDGRGGLDTLNGRGGADIFAFTTMLARSNVDTILDFANSTNSVHDTIRLSRAIFTQIGSGTALAAAAFKDITNGAAVDSSDRILYNRTTGALFYDADGSGTSSAAVQFATLDNKVTLSAADFAIGA